MIVKMEEYNICIRASSVLTEQCSVDDCEGKAAFNLHIINDSNHFIGELFSEITLPVPIPKYLEISL